MLARFLNFFPGTALLLFSRLNVIACIGFRTMTNRIILNKNSLLYAKMFIDYKRVLIFQDLRLLGKEKGWCPYFLARHMVKYSNVVVYSYQYLLDPKVAGIISKEMEKESVVVFDEAHNIDNVCIEALSVSVRRQTLEGATRNLSKMSQEIDRYALHILIQLPPCKDGFSW